MKFLVFGDIHLKPSGVGFDFEQLQVPDDVDAVLSVGDITHRAGEEDVEYARRFFRELDEAGVPVIHVPGNHDHHPYDEAVVEGFENVVSGHRATADFGELCVVGWGCEKRSLTPVVDVAEFESLDPSGARREDQRHAADQSAEVLESAVFDYVTGENSGEDLVEKLDIQEEEEQGVFYEALKRVEEVYEEVSTLLVDQSDVVFVSHLPPFNCSFDRHHAVGKREIDREELHVGSLPLKLALRTADVSVAVSGHSHNRGYDTVDGSTHLLNYGFQGVGSFSVSSEGDGFGFEYISS